MKKIVVIGSCNVDYIGFVNNKLIPKDSNVGEIYISFGGVGRNICENLLRLGNDVTMFTALSNDTLGKQMESELLQLGCKIIKPLTDKSSAGYLCVNDEHNDMAVAICDETIMDDLDIEFLSFYKDTLNESDYIVVDGNLKQEVIDYVVTTYKHKKLVADGISTTKVKKYINHLDKFFLFKVNELEYECIKECKKPKYLICTKGAKSVEYYDDTKHEIAIKKETNIVSTTGCGDALLSGTLSSIVNGKNIDEAIRDGLELARLTLFCKGSVYKK